MRVLVKIYWSEGDDKWHMCNALDGKFIQEFYDCANFQRFFPAADKTKPVLFDFSAVPYGEKHGKV